MPIPKQKGESFPKTAKERVYSVMREWIVDGTLKPDEKIFDRDIADYFSVSRTPVREAFQLLAEQQLIVISPGKESRVSAVDPASIRQSYEILATLDAIAVKYALPNITPSIFVFLNDNTESLRQALASADAKATGNIDHVFHEMIRKLSGNDFLYRFCDTLETQVARMEYLFFSQRRFCGLLPLSVDEHTQIIAALEARDEALAMKTMSDNWLHTIPYIENAFSVGG